MIAAMKQLSSRHHPLVAEYKALARGRGEGEGRLLLDGIHLLSEAARAGLRLYSVAATARANELLEVRTLVEGLAGGATELFEVSESMMEAMSPVSTPSGVVGIASRPAWSLKGILDPAPQLIVVGVDVQEPGNVGAIVRAAEACGATGVVFCGASADPFGWKALRGSMGSALRFPVLSAGAVEAVLEAARGAGVRLAAAEPRGGTAPRSLDLRQPVAFILGGEGPGLARTVVEAADLRVSLPMRPPVESLNVAVAAALLVYEAANQRTAT
jgi:RNA methyltransferase, TrmH family